MRDGTYWQTVVVMDDLRTTYLMLTRMEEQCAGEPKYFPFHQAAEAVWGITETLQAQLEAAGRNAFYNQDKRG